MSENTTRQDWDKDLTWEGVGDGGRPVGLNECVQSIAWSGRVRYDWQTLWDDARNRQLKQKRENPNVLYRRDRVYLPEPRQKWESGGCEQRHRFRCRQRWTMLRVRCLHYGEPLADKPYRLEVDDRVHEGRTNGEGEVEERIRVTDVAATLHVGEGDELFEYELEIGSLDPVETVQGVKMRLNNLGYAAETPSSRPTRAFIRALFRFQHDHGLRLTGKPDADTQKRLKDVYGA